MSGGIKLNPHQLFYSEAIFILLYLFLVSTSFFFFLPFKEKMVMLLSGYILSMGNNIDIVVVQLNNPHNKILPWASHILLVTACFIICCIILEI